MVPGVLGLKCMLSLIIILNVNKMGKDNEYSFNIKKLEAGIEKLKEQKKLPDDFKLKGIGEIIAWGEMTEMRDGVMKDVVVLWWPNGFSAMGIKGESIDQLIYDDNNDIVLGRSQLLEFDLDTRFYIGDIRNR